MLGRMTYLRRVFKITHKKGNKSPQNYEMDYENLQICMKDNCTLKGWFVEADSFNTVIIFHNLNGNKEKYLKRIKYLHNINWNVVIFDLRSHGESDYTGIRIFHKVLEDGMNIINYVFNNIAQKKGKIVLYGFSIGAYIASSCMSMEMVNGIILDSGPAINIKEALFKMAGRVTTNRIDRFLTFQCVKLFYGYRQKDIKKLINNFRHTDKAVLFIHGDRDEFVIWKDTRKIYDICNSKNKIYLLIKGSHHLTNDIYDLEKYERELSDFFNNVV